MTDKVLKAFNTVSQRFKPGMDVSESDITPPLDYADLKTRGFIGSDESVLAAKPFAGVFSSKAED